MRKGWEIFRFEFAYQLQRPWTWLSMAVMMVFALFATRVAILPVTLPQDFILNSPFIITSVSVFSCQIWLLLAPVVAGEVAARDVQTRMHPLLYTSPISKAAYFGGRFFAALALQALILFGVQVGSLLAVYGPGANPDLVGPFRPAAYLAAYGFVALTNALIATAFQFSLALFTGRSMASYFGSLMLFFLSYPVTFTLYFSGLHERALLADPIGVMAIMNEMMSNWTLVEKNKRLFTLEGAMLGNRVLWLGIALGTLGLVYLRFRFAHRATAPQWSPWRRWMVPGLPAPETGSPSRPAPSVPQVQPSLGFAGHLHQTGAILRSSFRWIVTSPGGLFLLVAFPLLLTAMMLVELQHWGVPLLPRTPHLLTKYLTGALTSPTNYWVMVPLFTLYYAGELVWRERDAGLNEQVDAMPVPEWVFFLGKFLGLGLVLALLMAIVVVVGVTVQVIRGYYTFQLGRYVQVLLGLQLTDYLLFAALAFTVQAVVSQKYLGHIVALVAYLLMVFSSFLGIEHPLLVYASGPDWSLTDLRGWGGSVGPWLWFRGYWAAWALLLALLTRLLWVRGQVSGFKQRLHLVRLRFTQATAGVAAVALGSILLLGGFLFYHTNVLHEYLTEDALVQRRADYERRYGQYEGIPQPQRTATRLQVDLHPDRRAATIRGRYRLVNRHQVPIDSVHLEPAFYVKTHVTFDRPARAVVADELLGHFIYALDEPLLPGDSLTLCFEVQFAPQGFGTGGLRHNGAGQAILENGTYLTGSAFPVIGYQPQRELWSADDRRQHGLPRQLTLPPPGDLDPHQAAGSAGTFEAIVSTATDQIAVAPGELRRTWRKAGRRYFHYVSEVPIGGMEVFFSADYTFHREQWRGVDVQVYVHPGHAEHLERLLRSARASLDYYTTQFGPYPYRFLQLIEQPGNFLGMGVDGSGVLTAGEGFFLLDPRGYGFDAIFEIVAHEMGHQWWGMQLKPAFAEGGGVLSESLAWYSAMQLVKHEKGREALRRFVRVMRQPNPWPPMRTGLPLLRAMDPWANYRKGPYAMHALSEYVGEARVNGALCTLLQKKKSSLATTLDLYRELQAVTPDSLRPLLHDLFAATTFWTFDTKQATAQPTAAGAWQVQFEVEARKVVVDSAGRETERPVDQWVEVGIFAAPAPGVATPGERLGKPLYVQKHFIRSGTQTIQVTVPHRPTHGGLDPYHLLDWQEGDNIENIQALMP
ncbi:ABC-2 family transporter protein [Catalinimonas alkaloidigena]|uniref:ABC-2 family transporter protein n=1 Tax=Catalinimonas alkaloidigena TaxID=1075417 RepID=A0A1G9UX06_9BACT|nr:ABC transporter permease [Catalinimonas alkaloidigena]SDM64433.1 ABC-2 family transporter protein [Catalinimonas alkaloidigena]